jgi:hypothetical protein
MPDNILFLGWRAATGTGLADARALDRAGGNSPGRPPGQGRHRHGQAGRTAARVPARRLRAGRMERATCGSVAATCKNAAWLTSRRADVLLSWGAPADGRADPSQRGRLAGAAPRRGNPNISTLWRRPGRAHRQDYVGGYVSFRARSRVTMYGAAYPDLAATGFRTRYQRFATTCPRHRTALSAVSVKWPNCTSW